MSAPNPYVPEHHHHRQDSRGTAMSSTPSADTVSGFPLVHVYAPPMGHDYGLPQQQQQQFPPPLPAAQYFQYGAAGYEYKPPEYAAQSSALQPPSLYYSRYPPPNAVPVSAQQRGLPPPLVVPAGHVASRQIPHNYNNGRVYTMTFDDCNVRNDYIKRVLALLLLQFIVSAALSALCLENSGVRKAVKGLASVLWLSLVGCLMVIIFTKLKPETSRKPYPERYIFVAWTAFWAVSLAWITSLLNLQFLLVLQILLAVIIASLLISSALQKTALLTGRTLLTTGSILLIVAIPLGAFYADDPGVVFFAIFVSVLIMIFFLFRVHYLMGDEWRKLQPHEALTGAMNVYF